MTQQRRIDKRWWQIIIFVVVIIAIGFFKFHRDIPVDRRSELNLDQRIELSFDLARYKLANTIYYFSADSNQNLRYPSYTHNRSWQNFLRNPRQKRRKIPNGYWLPDKAKFWAAGAFPGLLWKMQAYETDPAMKKYWQKSAKIWGEPLRKLLSKNPEDMTINNLIVFQPWFETTSGTEKMQQLATILQGARYLAEPFEKGKKGRFHRDIGVMGFERKATRTDNKTYWHAFIDHTINVEQLLWAAEHNRDRNEAKIWQSIAVEHIKTLAKTFGVNRRPGDSGTWQRGYFDHHSNSPTYSQFLFNEGKQGWKDDSIWSRGQAWFIYGASITYQYVKDPELLRIAKETIDYFLTHLPDRFPDRLRREGDFIPPWDFDYALEKNPDTERDSSAAAIAASGILKLLRVLPNGDPDKQRYLQDVEKILLNLTSSEYLPDREEPEMGLLRHGCYHHFASITPSDDYDNALIWGDYFFIDALMEYQKNFSS